MGGVTFFLRSGEAMQVHNAVRGLAFCRVEPDDPRFVVGFQNVLGFVGCNEFFELVGLLWNSRKVRTPPVFMWRGADEVDSNEYDNWKCDEEGFAGHIPKLNIQFPITNTQ